MKEVVCFLIEREVQRKEVATKMMVNIKPSEDFFMRKTWIMRRGISD